MEGKRWLYSLIDEMGRSFRKEGGLIAIGTDPKPIRHTPDGAQDISIGWERNMTRYGVTRNFSLPFGFIRDGADILRHLFYTRNFEQKVFLLIKKQQLFLSDEEYYYWYKYFYRGELDFTKVNDEATKTTINIMEGGTSKDLKANEGTMYELPLEIPEAVYVKMDGINLVGKQNMAMLDGFVMDPNVFEEFIIPTVLLNVEGKSTGLAFGQAQYEKTADIQNNSFFEYLETSKNYFVGADLENDTPINAHISGRIRPKLTLKRDIAPFWAKFIKVEADFKASDLSDAKLHYYTVFRNGVTPFPLLSNTGDFASVDFDFNIPLAPGERIFFDQSYSVAGSGRKSDFEFLENSLFSVEYINRYKETYIRALRPAKVGNMLTEKITGKTGLLRSQLLDDIENLVLTSGDGLRRLPGAVIKTRFNDFEKHTNVIKNSGTGIEGDTIVIERKPYFFNNSTVIPLGKVKELSISQYNEIIVNTIKYGWPDQDYDDVNGKQEFNTTALRSSPIKKVVKELDLVSPYRADCYGIEFTRINFDGKTTTDSSSDNDVFVINIDIDNPQVILDSEVFRSELSAGTVYYNLKRESYDSIEGLIEPGSVFNIEELTGARILEQHESWLGSIFYGFDAGQLIFETTTKNRELKTVKAGKTYDEDAPINISSFKNRLLKPIVFDFEPRATNELVEIMEINPNRCFSFDHPHGKVYKGFNLKVGIAPNTLEEQAFQLISTFDNDLTDLQYGQNL